MNNFNYDPVNGFRDASAYRNPQSEQETRDMFQTPLDQVKDFINTNIVPLDTTVQGNASAITTLQGNVTNLQNTKANTSALGDQVTFTLSGTVLTITPK